MTSLLTLEIDPLPPNLLTFSVRPGMAPMEAICLALSPVVSAPFELSAYLFSCKTLI